MSESYDSESATGLLDAVETKSPPLMDSQTGSLEQALAEIEAEAGDLVKTTKQVMASFKKIKDAAKVGDLVKLRKLLDEGKAATLGLGCDFVKTQERLNFDEASYLAGNDFRQELLTTAQQMGVNLYEHDGYLFSYPVLLKILHKERAVSIDRMRESRLRPSVLVKRLKEVQNKPLRFKPQTFLEMLYTAYSIVVAGRGKHLVGKGIACEHSDELYREAAAATAVIQTEEGFGAGVFIGPELIVTAKHVVDGKKVKARIPKMRDDDLAKPGDDRRSSLAIGRIGSTHPGQLLVPLVQFTSNISGISAGNLIFRLLPVG